MSEKRPKKCSDCKSPASVHLTQVIDGELVKVSLCSNCAQAKSVEEAVAWDLIGVENGGKTPKSPRLSDRACTGCGLTPADFKETGRLGCAKCYEVFEAKLEPVIRRLHKGVSHIGKVPGGQDREASPEEIAALKRRLDEHVSREEYEMAAVVRDQIKSLGH